jgi:uncharacterized protein YjiS (DUF1127 family)
MTTSPDIESAAPKSLLHRVLAAWLARRARHTAARELRGMSEHELKDLGIGRSEIPAQLAQRGGPKTATRLEPQRPSTRFDGLGASGA